MANKNKKDDFVPLKDLKLSPKQRDMIDEIGTMLGELSNQAKPHKEALKKLKKSEEKLKLKEKFKKATADFEARRIKGENWKSYWKDGGSFISVEKLLDHGVPIATIEACKEKRPGTRVVVGIDDEGEE